MAKKRAAATPFAIPANRWDDKHAKRLKPAELLLYRSNLLGSDLTVTNFGGGNSSAQLRETDPPTGEKVDVLWVKGSGGDIVSMKLDGFSTFYQDKYLGIEKHYAGPDDDDKMVEYLPHCNFNLNTRTASIDTPLHALLPFAHNDHVHPDAIIALAASSGGAKATKEIWGGKIGWLPWKPMKKQGGASVVFIGSKNAVAAASGASAYASAKAEAHYRNSSMLKRDVLSEDVAAAASGWRAKCLRRVWAI